MKVFPKVLIIGESFHHSSGGGITLSNLFRNWPKDKIAVASNARMIRISSNDICNTYYQLGEKEILVFKPIRFLQRKYKSGEIIKNSNSPSAYVETHSPKIIDDIRKCLVKIFINLLHFFGLFHSLYRFHLSKEFKNWITELKPDVIYSQLASYELMLFIDDISKIFHIPLAIHMMDDWPKTISKTSILQKYWENKIDRLFQKLLNKAKLLLSISESMTEEYEKRYNKIFISFHNPVDLQKWIANSKKDYALNRNHISILYSGRIGIGVSETIINIAKAIELLNQKGIKAVFYIQSTNIPAKLIRKLKIYNNVNVNDIVPYESIPMVFSSADILILPVDFNSKSQKFMKFSMPTKVSEYMISGTPIILYCSESVSLHNHALKNGWAYIVSEDNVESVAKGIIDLSNDIKLRKTLGENAFNYAVNNFNSATIRESFRETFVNALKWT